ncbi:hypothetical protein AWZ03_009300 [Drosophila navojoa]|uniref:Uncharacterized protein n=1 Tax=Drosophila navojoa TaxID=7232 RepID=A0A484B7K5_DRONA|nr:hypothetical protein AWZ03_009300 [Drosophila navojoa]
MHAQFKINCQTQKNSNDDNHDGDDDDDVDDDHADDDDERSGDVAEDVHEHEDWGVPERTVAAGRAHKLRCYRHE